MIQSPMTLGLALAATLFAASAIAAQQPKQQEPREPLPSEIVPLADQVIFNGVARAGGFFVAVGARGVVLRSADGNHWRQIKIPTRAMLTRVVFYNDQIGWAVGWDGAILRTTDAGQSWKLVNFEPEWGKPYFDVLPTGPDSATVVGSNGRVIRTDDAGQTWQQTKNEVFARRLNFYDIQTIGKSGRIIAGERGMTARSLDGGHTWQMLKPAYNGSFFGALPVGKHGVVLYGLEAEIYYAPDIRTLPTLADPMKYSPFRTTQITDSEKLAKMGWRHIDGPVNESLFGGLITKDHWLVLVGVDGNVIYGPLASDKLKLAKNRPTSEPLSDIMITNDGWLLTGRGGIYHMAPAH